MPRSYERVIPKKVGIIVLSSQTRPSGIYFRFTYKFFMFDHMVTGDGHTIVQKYLIRPCLKSSFKKINLSTLKQPVASGNGQPPFSVPFFPF